MEEPQTIAQQPLEKTPDRTIPQIETNFGDDAFDSSPIKRGHVGGFNEWIFSLMRPKRKVIAAPKRTIPKELAKPIAVAPQKAYQASPDANLFIRGSPRSFTIPSDYEVQNGLVFRKKTLAERVRDQLQYPIIKSSASTVNGISLAVFAVGAYLLYSALPTRPDLILGIVLVSLAGNVIMNNR